MARRGSLRKNRKRVLIRYDDDLAQPAEADRREVDPQIQVETATWSKAGQLDWWVKDRLEWFGRVCAGPLASLLWSLRRRPATFDAPRRIWNRWRGVMLVEPAGFVSTYARRVGNFPTASY
jgi:hypothetical protein